MSGPVMLIIRDGWGINPAGRGRAKENGDATLLARTPFHDQLYPKYPLGKLSASGLDVGLPAKQMGNSEVGHLNLGAGRIVYQELLRIGRSIDSGEFFQNPAFLTLLQGAASGDRSLHLLCLLSDGGSHSHQRHLWALLDLDK